MGSHSTTFVANDISNLVLDAFRQALVSPVKSSRNGNTRSIQNLNLVLTDPRQRWLNLEGRKSNVFALLAETLWVLSGSDKIDPYLSFFLPRAKDFSDDGVTWRGGYGPRLFQKDSILEIVKMLSSDPYSRRAVLNIYDNNLDSPNAIKEQGLNSSKDIPCNNWIHFYITDELVSIKKSLNIYGEVASQDIEEFYYEEELRPHLNMKVVSRSGDLIWGLGSINIFEWTFLQELVYDVLKKNTNVNDLRLGYYYHTTTDAHLYSSADGLNTASQAEEAVSYYNSNTYIPGEVLNLETEFVDFNDHVYLAKDWCRICSEYIQREETDYTDFIHSVDLLLSVYKLQGFYSTILRALAFQIISKRTSENIVISIDPELSFWQAVESSKFTKFKVKYL